ncbi:hypothetical protein Tco_1225242 [Tanacetum coccineum]
MRIWESFVIGRPILQMMKRLDQAKTKAKAGTSLAGLENVFDVESLAKLMANEYTMVNDPYDVQKGQEMTELLRIKKQELELKAAELEIRRLENRQRDEALYFSTTNEELKAILRARLFSRFYIFYVSM